jgi:signal transduction histidine kinase
MTDLNAQLRRNRIMIDLLRSELKHLRRERDDLLHKLNRLEGQATTTRTVQLANDIHHDLINGLGAIRGLTRTLDTTQSSSDQNSPVVKILSQIEFCELALRNLLLFLGQGDFLLEKIDLAVVIKEVQAVLSPKLVDIDWNIDIPDHVQEILGDRNQIKLAITNLVRRLGKMMPDGGTLSFAVTKKKNAIAIKITGQRKKLARKSPKIDLQDHSDMETFTSDARLQITQEIIKRHEGTITFTGNIKKAITCTVRLPIESRQSRTV